MNYYLKKTFLVLLNCYTYKILFPIDEGDRKDEPTLNELAGLYYTTPSTDTS